MLREKTTNNTSERASFMYCPESSQPVPAVVSLNPCEQAVQVVPVVHVAQLAIQALQISPFL